MTDTSVPVRVRPRVAVVGIGEVPAQGPAVRADDLGLGHGDGCFETLRVLGRADGPPLVQRWAEHLERLAGSCAAMDLPAPDGRLLQQLVADLTDEVPEGAEAVLRLLVTRGAPGQGPTTLVTLSPIGPGLLRQRAEGVRAVSLPLGLDVDVVSASPWLLGGAKTLSYAVAFAALREAARRDADDALLLDVRGRVLEAATAAVLWSAQGQLRCPHGAGTGILAGTVQRAVLDAAFAAGTAIAQVEATVADLRAADAVWFTSSLRGVAEVTALDGTALRRDPAATARLRDWAGF
ncbi:aminotransferase class IV [Kineococcus sp. SYSU DK003]|uniref:aminotransferase class IV n=1 Tax=Kineococcus sp. SYSU DK003 TaxID=3383124 RepID=UPI003D7CF01E